MYVSYFCKIYALYWIALNNFSNIGFVLLLGGVLLKNTLPFGKSRLVLLFWLLLNFIFLPEFGEIDWFKFTPTPSNMFEFREEFETIDSLDPLDSFEFWEEVLSDSFDPLDSFEPLNALETLETFDTL